MASAINKKIQAALCGDALQIIQQTIYNRELQFEIKDDDVAKHGDIKEIFFEDCFMMKVPGAICLLKIAPNLNNLTLLRTNLTRICSQDLRGFEKLETLYVGQNIIEELPSDLFTHTPNLQTISFASNKIKVIGEKILKPLKNLNFFDLSENPGINACYIRELAGKKGRQTLAQFKEVIGRCEPVQNVWNTVSELKNLKRKFEAQEKKMIDWKKLCVEQGAKIERLEKKLEEAKQDGAFLKFNFTIKINEKTFKVQKEILAANSPLLAEMIRDNEDPDTLELKDISEEVFEEIWNFMVKKTQPKQTANFIEIYAASGLLQMKELMDLCAQTLMEKITEENALEILYLCKKYPNIELGKKALDQMKNIYDKP